MVRRASEAIKSQQALYIDVVTDDQQLVVRAIKECEVDVRQRGSQIRRSAVAMRSMA